LNAFFVEYLQHYCSDITNICYADKAIALDVFTLWLKVCDGAGDPCDAVCGGAGCGKCGGPVSCDEGAVTKSIQAIDLANQSESILVVRKREIETIYNSVSDRFFLHFFWRLAHH